jgi:hypothetical protein
MHPKRRHRNRAQRQASYQARYRARKAADRVRPRVEFDRVGVAKLLNRHGYACDCENAADVARALEQALEVWWRYS